jgi:enolase
LIIEEIVARKVFDGKGNPTIEAEVRTSGDSTDNTIAHLNELIRIGEVMGDDKLTPSPI